MAPHPKPGFRKLGIRQSLGLAKAKPRADPKADPLSSALVTLYSAGALSSGHVGELASASLESNQTASSSSAPPPAAVKRLARAKHAPKLRARKVGSKPKADSRNSARTLNNALKMTSDSKHGTYTSQIPMWDSKHAKQVMKPMAFLPIHEMLEEIVPWGQEQEWCAFPGDHSAFKMRLQEWADRVGASSDTLKKCVTIVLWGRFCSSHKEGLTLSAHMDFGLGAQQTSHLAVCLPEARHVPVWLLWKAHNGWHTRSHSLDVQSVVDWAMAESGPHWLTISPRVFASCQCRQGLASRGSMRRENW